MLQAFLDVAKGHPKENEKRRHDYHEARHTGFGQSLRDIIMGMGPVQI
jgi:hypothetical protein